MASSNKPNPTKTPARSSGGIIGAAGRFVNQLYKNIARNTGADMINDKINEKKRID